MKNLLIPLLTISFFQAQTQLVDTTRTIRIPVIFHVIYTDHQHSREGGGNTSENLTDSQLLAEFADLHRDFLLLNTDVSQVIPPFRSIVANPHIDFYLADTVLDANGTKGIHRVHRKHVRRRLLSKYSPVINDEKYLNVYIGNIGGSFSPGEYPWLYPETDAIYLGFDWIGKGYRLLTHETGHWCGLLHLWGTGSGYGDRNSCTVGDSITDTPPQREATQPKAECTDCPPPIGSAIDKSCANGQPSNFNNFMDYSRCRRMFTQGQVIHMRETLQNYRTAIWNTP